MRAATSLKSSKIYITLKMSLGRVFETIFPFLIFHKKNEDRAYYRQLSHILAFKSPKLLFHIQYKNLYTKSHTLFITKKTLVCCKAINSCYIKLQKLITFGIRLGICVLSYHYTFIFSFHKRKLWVLATAGC